MKNKIVRLAGVAAALGAVAFLAAAVLPTPTALVTHIGPFFQAQFAVDSATGKGIGGQVEQFMTKSTDTLYIGEAVALCAKNIVCKSATQLNPIGIVVGGASTSYRVIASVADTMTRASLPSRWVYVLTRGRTYCVVSATGIAPGASVMVSATAGRVAIYDTTKASNRMFATIVDTAVSGTAGLCDVRR